MQKKKKASANIFHSHLGQEINNLKNKNSNREVWRKNTATYKCDVAFKGVCARAKCVFLEENKRVCLNICKNEGAKSVTGKEFRRLRTSE